MAAARPVLALSFAPIVPRRPLSLGRSSDLAFAIVVVAAVAPAFFGADVSPTRASIGVAPAVVFLALGLGWRAIGRGGLIAYFAIQLALATVTVTACLGQSGLMILPLITQSTFVLPRRGVAVVIGILAAWISVLVIALGGPSLLIGSMLGFVSAAAFVAAFSELLLRERLARVEIERLADALRVANEQLEELATARERNRLAREIHDGIGHCLTVVHVQLQAAQAVMATDPERARGALRTAQRMTENGLADVRASVSALRGSALADRPLPTAVATLVAETEDTGIATTLVVTGTPRKLSPLAELAIYRAAQELLTNVRRHSRARSAEVELAFAADRVRLVVADDGVGGAAVSSEPDGGFGLVAMRERVGPLGGMVSVQPAGTGDRPGFRVDVEVPA